MAGTWIFAELALCNDSAPAGKYFCGPLRFLGFLFALYERRGKVSPKRDATHSLPDAELASNSEPMDRIPEAVELAQTL